jgi:DNA polymerase
VADIDRAEFILEEMSRERALTLARSAGTGGVSGARSGLSGARSGVSGANTVRSARVSGTSVPSEELAGGTIESAPDLDSLAVLVGRCTLCPLHRSRKNPVFGEGDPGARVVCVGEAPGAREDETGRPFVGRAGQLLDRLLRTIGLPRESVYICNVLKSRPPNNRDPLPEEVGACTPYLLRQLALIEPEVIVAFGAFAARTLLESTESLGRLRGGVHRYAGYPVVATYHPAALLRNPAWTRPAWEDLQIVRRILDTGAPGADTRHPEGSNG